MQLIRNTGLPLPAAALFFAQCRGAAAREAAAPETVRVAFDDINARTAQPAYRLELVTGLGFRTGARIEAERTALPTSCRMQRPPARERR